MHWSCYCSRALSHQVYTINVHTVLLCYDHEFLLDSYDLFKELIMVGCMPMTSTPECSGSLWWTIPRPINHSPTRQHIIAYRWVPCYRMFVVISTSDLCSTSSHWNAVCNVVSRYTLSQWGSPHSTFVTWYNPINYNTKLHSSRQQEI